MLDKEYNEFYQEAVLCYQNRTKRSKEAFLHAQNFLAQGETRSVSFHEPYPITVSRGKGSKLIDIDGMEYTDFINNYTSLVHGHAHPQITQAICEAAQKGTASPAGIEEQVTLAELIVTRVPSVEQVRFCNSGTEATMFAVRVARAYTGKNGIVKILGGYHGTTDLFEHSVSISKEALKKAKQWEALPDSKGISRHAGQDLFVIPYNNLEAAEEVIRANHFDLAALIVEPFLGAGGVIPAKLGYLQGLKKICEQYGVLLIFDEVQSLRLSIGGAQKKYNVCPDITAFGKIIGGGLPVGAFGGRKEIMEVFNRNKTGHLSQSGTFNGNRVTMAAGIKSLSLLNEEAIHNLELMGEQLEDSFSSIIKNLKIPACITREGSLLNLHFQKEKPYDYESGLLANDKLLEFYFLDMLNQGIFHAPRGTWVLSTAMTQEDLKKAEKAFLNTMKKCKEILSDEII